MPPSKATSRNTNGATVRALREALGIKQGAMAKDLGISWGYFANIESGAKQPSPQVVRNIAHRLGVSIDAITYVTEQDGAA